MLNPKRAPEILIVDDTPANLELLAGILKACGYAVRLAAHGEMALRAVRLRAPELILLDINMPGMDGYSVCRSLKAEPDLRHIPVIFISAQAEPGQKEAAFDCGGVDFITKPFSVTEIEARVGTHLRLGRLQRAMEDRNLRLQRTEGEQTASAAQESTIFALAKLAEAREAEDNGHLERIRAFCRLLAEAVRRDPELGPGLPDDFAETVYRASSLHDIGKTGIPDAILLKHGPLDEAEFEAVKRHTVVGSQTLAEVHDQYPNPQLAMAIDIARSHHEKWDGAGYPDGLAGADIPLGARIMAIADAYDAIRSRRCYKGDIPHEDACRRIAGEKGRHFDPRLTDLFLQLHEEFRRIYEEG